MDALFKTISDLAYGTALLYILALAAFVLLLAFFVMWEKVERFVDRRKQTKDDDKLFGEIEGFYAGISDVPSKD
jgi:hypothetical protein